MTKPRLEIIIVTYNSQFWLKKTLSSLKTEVLDQTKTNMAVTVVDNASQDDTALLMKQEFAWATYHQLNTNRGYSVANNLALKKSQAKYIMLLNSDIEFTPQSKLDDLLSYLDKHSDVAVITPRIEFSNGQLDPACHRGEPTPWASFCYFAKLEDFFPQVKLFGRYHEWYLPLDQIHQIGACSGAAMIARRSAIDQVGWLDEQFFMYAEDLDWCRRFRMANYQIIFYPLAKIIHHKYKSGIKSISQTIALQTKKHFYQTMLQYYDKHYRGQYPELVRFCLRVFIFIKRGAI
ncbi:MAG: glycosyltransferase family 2 protein [Patescibacteria group bacterium]